MYVVYEETLKYWGLIIAITVGVVALWKNLSMTDRLLTLWRITLGRTQVQLAEIIVMIHTLDDKIEKVSREVHAKNGKRSK